MHTNCSLHATCNATVGGALRETIATVLLSIVPRLPRQSCCLRSGHAGEGVVANTGLALMTGHLDDYHCSAEVRGSFQETAPRKTVENTVKHLDGGAGLVLANHRGGSESSVVVTTLLLTLTFWNHRNGEPLEY